jgi:hypothetical protein
MFAFSRIQSTDMVTAGFLTSDMKQEVLEGQTSLSNSHETTGVYKEPMGWFPYQVNLDVIFLFFEDNFCHPR